MSKFKKNSGISPWNLSEIEFYNSRNKMPGFIEKIWWMHAQVTSSKEKLQSNWFSFKKPMHIHTSKRQVLSLCLYITNRRNFHVQERKKKRFLTLDESSLALWNHVNLAREIAKHSIGTLLHQPEKQVQWETARLFSFE